MRTTKIFLAGLFLMLPGATADAGASGSDDTAWARYSVLLQGAWADEPAREETSDLVVEWLEGPPVHDRGGRRLPALHALWQGPDLVLEDLEWHDGAGERHYGPGGSLVSIGRSRTVQTSSIEPLGPYEESERKQTETYTRTYVDSGTRDCMLRPAAWQVADVRCLIPGLEDLGMAGRPFMERSSKGLHIWSDGPVARIDAQYHDAVPYAVSLEVRVASSQGVARAVLELVDWKGTPALPGAAGDAALEELRFRDVDEVLLDDSMVEHPFPLSEAVRLLHEEGSATNDGDDDRDFHDWYDAAGTPYVFYAVGRQVRDGLDAADHEWILGWTDGSDPIFVRAVRDGDPPGLLAETLGDDNVTFAVIDPPAGAFGGELHRSQAPDRTPMVAHMMEWWRAYAGSGRNGTPADAWGYGFACDACRAPELRIWVGQHAARTGVGEAGVLASSEETTTDLSALYVTPAGEVATYQETGRHLVTTQRVGPGPEALVSTPVRPGPAAVAVLAPDAATEDRHAEDTRERSTPPAPLPWITLGVAASACLLRRRSRQLL